MLAALDAHCGSPFWDWSTVWYTDNPDLSECFQKTVLIWIPCGLLWLYLPFEIYSVKKHRRRRIPWTLLNVSKIFLNICLIILSLIELFHWVVLYANDSVDVASVHFYSNFIKIVTFIAIAVLIALHRNHGLRSSGFLFTFWILFSFTTTVSFRTCLVSALDDESPSDILLYTICVLCYPLAVAQLVLSAVSDAPPVGSKRDKNACPVLDSAVLSRITFSWFDKMALLGYRRAITREDLWTLNEKYRSQNCFPQLQKNWEEIQRRQSSQGKKPSILTALAKTFWAPFILTGLMQLCANMSDFITPMVLSYLIDFISSGEPIWRGYFYCSILFFSSFIAAHFYTQQYWTAFRLGMRVRAAIISLIYRKAIRMTGNFKRTSSTGEIVNLMSIDTEHLHDVLPEFHTCWVGIIQVIICLYMLWMELGPSVLASLATLFLMVPVNAYIANKYHKLQTGQMKFKDQRIKLMNEILAGIKVLKLYAWEKSFFGQLTGIRNNELKMLKVNSYLVAFVEFFYSNVPIMVTLTTFVTYVLVDENNILDAKKVFVSITLFNILRFPLLLVPMMIVGIIQTSVSIKRLNKFFNEKELDPNAVSRDISAEHAISIENGTFSWDSDTDPVLKNVNVDCPHEHLVAVLGSVGSGKSSLISAVLGEMEKRNGRVNVKGSVALVAQQAWIQNATLRDNIIFGSPFDQNKYDNVLEACALKPDLDLLPAGDQTEIGERGINLSGGQKQRVSLARAVYSDADVYLLDDPLSAVDAHVGKHIFDNVIGPNGSLKNKTRLFVTNGISYLNQTDSIVVLDKGSVSEVGTFDQLVSKKGAFAEFLQNYLNEHEIAEASDERITSLETIIRMNSVESGSFSSRSILSPRLSLEEHEDITISNFIRNISRSLSHESGSIKRILSTDQLHQDRIEKSAKLIEAEESATGKVKWSVYNNYFKSLGMSSVVVLVVSFAASTGFNAYSNIWLSDWSQDPPERNDELRNRRLSIYGALGFGQVFLLLVGCLALASGSIRASRTLHNNMLINVLRSPLSFFDTTPLGRILNRFSKDIDLVDGELSQNIYPMLSTMMQAIAVVIIICLSTPLILTVIVPTTILYFLVQRFYIASSRQLKRLEFVAHSPIFSQFSETLFGSSTIRAFKRVPAFILESERLVDEYHTCAYPSLAANRWLGVRLSVIGNLLCFFAALFAVISRNTIDPGIMGLTVSYASTEVLLLIILVRTACELEANIVAVERIIEYTNTPSEAPEEIESTRPGEGWPYKGEVQFKNYSTRYREGLDLVLNQLNCDIQQEEKVGIVGRTGAGKSSLALALFRIVEPSYGKIFIDDVDITTLGLSDLRSRLTVIPQDPVLFSGTLRMNLDPFDKYSDEQVWKALEHSHLKSFVTSLPLGLQHVVSEGGENLSVGQRQLVCLARALLRKSKVLVLDEATAAVDLETDEIIQATIRKEFADCTVITIAHRLNTIMDSTRIMVLDSGRIKEFDTPENLMKTKETHFYGLARDAGLVT